MRRLLFISAARCGALIVLLPLAGMAMAHPGGLNKQGCHNNRQTGDYHCHRAPAAAPSAPMRLAPPPGPSNPGSRPGTSYPNCAAARRPALHRYDVAIRVTVRIWTATATASAANDHDRSA
jgi:hypothetical protein